MASKHSLYSAIGLLLESVSKVLPGEVWSISRILGEVGSEDVEALGDVAAEAVKEEGWELAKFNILGELEEEVVVVEVKLRSVLRGFLSVPPLLLLLLLLILVGKGQVVSGEVMEGPSESTHLNTSGLSLNQIYPITKQVIFDLTFSPA